jgi:hypothetical protein
VKKSNQDAGEGEARYMSSNKGLGLRWTRLVEELGNQWSVGDRPLQDGLVFSEGGVQCKV